MARVGDAVDALDDLREELSPSPEDREAALRRLILAFANLAKERGFTVKEHQNEFGIYVEAGLIGEHIWVISGPKRGEGIYFWRDSNKVKSAPVTFRYSRIERDMLGDLYVEPNGSKKYEPAIDKLAREFVTYVRELAKHRVGA